MMGDELLAEMNVSDEWQFMEDDFDPVSGEEDSRTEPPSWEWIRLQRDQRRKQVSLSAGSRSLFSFLFFFFFLFPPF